MYFLYYQTKNHGPYALDQIRSMWASGIITADAVYWVQAESVWKPIAELLAAGQPASADISTPASKHKPESAPAPAAPSPARGSQVDASSTALPTGPKKIGGWLVFFCVGLTILSPIFSLRKMVSTWVSCQFAFASYPILKTVLIWESGCSIALLIYGFVVGVMIWSGNPAGRSIAKRFLLMRLCGFLTMELIAFIMMSELPDSLDIGVLGGLAGVVIRELGYFLIWWLYFIKSKRVRNTYGDETSTETNLSMGEAHAPASDNTPERAQKAVGEPNIFIKPEFINRFDEGAATAPSAKPSFSRRVAAIVAYVVVAVCVIFILAYVFGTE
jgi:hypothetical protein